MILLANIRKTDTYLDFLENSIIFVEPINRLIWSILSLLCHGLGKREEEFKERIVSSRKEK